MILLTSLNSEISAKQNSIDIPCGTEEKHILSVKCQTTECICENCKFEKEHTKLVELRELREVDSV